MTSAGGRPRTRDPDGRWGFHEKGQQAKPTITQSLLCGFEAFRIEDPTTSRSRDVYWPLSARASLGFRA
jgi:hypothetical protein